MKNLINSIKRKAILLLPLIIFMIVSCTTGIQVEAVNFAGKSEIVSGEDAVFDWEFINADKVRIDGVPGKQGPVGTMRMNVERSRSVNFTVYDEYGDSVAVFPWEIIVSDPENSFLDLKTSEKTSPYLQGMILKGKNSEPARLKLMKTFYPQAGNEFMTRFLVFDENGNYIPGIEFDKAALKLNSDCQDGSKITVKPGIVRENWENDPANRTHIAIAIDNSAAARNNKLIISNLTELAQEYKLNDMFSLVYFNQNSSELLPVSEKSGTAANFDNVLLPEPSGFNSLYRSSVKLLSDMNEDSNPVSALVLITSFADNSSILYDASDLSELAREYGVPVYIVAVGNSYNSYELKYVTDFTGGRLYEIDNDEIQYIKNILLEIIFSQKSYYESRFSVKNSDLNCADGEFELNMSDKGISVSDFIRFVSDTQMQYSDYQAVAGFAFKTSALDTNYYPVMNLLSQAINLNTEKGYVVELVGHTGIEGNDEFCNRLSLERAQEVREYLIKNNVDPKYIRIRAEGNNLPVFYLEENQWQAEFNRRVEVRWLRPEQLPYEIIAQEAVSEETALSFVTDWENKGYRAYYERSLRNREPVYIVNIWGWKSEEEAVKTAAELMKLYKIDCKVK